MFFNLHVTGLTGPASGPLSFHTKIQKGLKLTLTRFAAACWDDIAWEIDPI